MIKVTAFRTFLAAAVAAAVVKTSHGFANYLPSRTLAEPRSTSVFSSSNGVESFSLKNFENHEEEGEKMAKSITAWLNAEWMPQEVHVKMAHSAKQSYIRCRESGEDDLMTIMTTIADELSANWDEYDSDAFIGAWDIVNYVSDYLVQASGGESCECSAKIF